MNELFNKVVLFVALLQRRIPKSLIEACASGCAIVTTNVTGCREVVKK